ncbi:MAG: M16 family metallopeptidase [Nitrospinota bacterium]
MKILRRIVVSIFAFTFLAGPASARDLEKMVVEHTLANGLKLLLLKRDSSPTVATSIMFKTGSIDEETGYTGIAHFLEHMLFKGTKTLGTKDFKGEEPLLRKIEKVGEALDLERLKGTNGSNREVLRLERELKELQDKHKKFVIKDEFAEIYSKNGGVGYNAWTSSDVTSYIIRLPSNKLELWAGIESDRMKNPVLREFYQERDVIVEERRSSYDNSPGGSLYENMLSTAFKASPYSHPTIGWPSDIRFLPKKKVERFLKTYYAPNNCVISIVGDIDPQTIIAMVELYFGDIPKRELPQKRFTKEPVQAGERRTQVEFDANEQVMIAFHKPTMPHDDDYVFDVIDFLLSGGRTSRLYKRLVLEDKIAVSASTFGAPGSRLDNLFLISAVPRAPHTVAEIEKVIYEELEKLKKVPVPRREIEKILNKLEAEKIKKMRSNSGMASELSYYQTVGGDWRYTVQYLDNVKKVTPEKIIRTAKKYLTKKNRTVATLVKKKKKNSKQEPL